MNRYKSEFIASLIGVLIFAHYFEVIEHWLDWSKVHSSAPLGLTNFPDWHGVTAYHYLFAFSLFLLIASLPFLPRLLSGLEKKLKTALLILGNTLLAGWVADMAYFYLWGTWIEPHNWTCNILGYTEVGAVIPNWYFLMLPSIVAVYWCASECD